MIKRLAAFDFDGTLMDSPEKESGMQNWSEKKGEPYPHKGWWGRKESLDLDVFDIQPFPSILNQLKKELATPNTYVIVLTSRLERLRPEVQAVLDKNNIRVHKLDMKDGWEDKGQKILDYVKEFPQLEEINVYDDMDERIAELKSVEELIPDNINFNVYRANKGNLTLTEDMVRILDIINEEISNVMKK